MRQPKGLTDWELPDNEYVPDGYDMKQVPKATDRNFNMLLDEYNNLAEIVTEIARRLNIDFNNENQE